jgi:hypothetical protein
VTFRQAIKEANLVQADYIGEILRTEGFETAPIKGEADNGGGIQIRKA